MSYPSSQDLPNRGEMTSSEGGENGGRKTLSGWRNEDIPPQYPREYKIQRDSIPKIRTKFRKKKTSGKRQMSGRESNRWCFVMES